MIRETIMNFIYKFIIKRKCPLCGHRMSFTSILEYPNGANMVSYQCNNCNGILHSPYKIFSKDIDVDMGDLDE